MILLDEELMDRIKNYITDYQEVCGSSPTQRDIAARFDITLPRVYRFVHALKNRGVISLNSSGEIAVLRKLDKKLQFVPKIGFVRCGKPTLTIEDYDEAFRLPREFTGEGEFLMLEAEGDSMIGANIFPGDLLVIRRQETANSGDIVVAVKESEFGCEEADGTLKRYKYNNGKYVLHAENDNYEDMDASDFRIIGKLKCIIRDMEIVK